MRLPAALIGGKLNCLCGPWDIGIVFGMREAAVSWGRFNNASIENGFCDRNAECTAFTTADPAAADGDLNAELSPPKNTHDSYIHSSRHYVQYLYYSAVNTRTLKYFYSKISWRTSVHPYGKFCIDFRTYWVWCDIVSLWG